jgi:5'-nucleotidase
VDNEAAVTTRSRRAFLAALLLTAVWAARGVADVPPPASVTILHFNDVYEIDAVEDGRAGGLARVATTLARLKRGGPVLSTLGGDFLSPSAIGTARVDGEALAGKQMVGVLNTLGLNWATLGNHEFDLSEAAFRARLAEVKFRIVSSNVTDAAGQPFPGTVKSAVVPIVANGRTLRLGLIGLTIDSTRKPWVQYQDPVEAARAQVAQLRGRTDAVVALTHLSLAGDQALVEGVPEIDLALGGHEHENWMIRRGPAFTPIVKADANVRSVAVVSLGFRKPGERPTVSARLEVLDSKVAQDRRVQAEVQRWIKTAFDAFRKDGFAPEVVIAKTTTVLDGRESTVRNKPGPLTDLITAAMAREAGQVDVVLLNGGSIRIDDELQPGPIRQYDVIRILPFGGKIVRATFEGSLLAEVLDIGVTNRGSGGYLQLRGVTRSDSTWLIQGKPLDRGAKYVVAVPEFLLTGGEANLKFLTRTEPRVSNIQDLRDVRLAVIDELKATK